MHGIHWEGDIAFLIQAGKPQTAFAFDIPCPIPPRRGVCNTRIVLGAAPTADFPVDPLVDAMSPVPRALDERIPFLVSTDHRAALATLARLSSPVQLPIRTFWTLSPAQIVRQLGETNVQPLVLVGVKAAHRSRLDQVLEAAPMLPRRLLLVGDRDVILRPEAEKISTTLGQAFEPNVQALPWEAYGAHLLKRHMLSKGS